MSALYPNVPDVPGVPAVLRSTLFPADESTQDPLDSSGSEANADIANQWGVFTQDGDAAFPADNMVGFELSADSRISDYPVEMGGFGSYNKVIVPYDTRVIMSTGGSVQDRQDFLGAVQDAVQSTDLYNVVTPECVYMDVNVTTVRTVRAADRGSGLLTLEIALRKVRQTATLTFTQTKDPASAGQVNDGSVQLAPVSGPGVAADQANETPH